MYSGDDFKFREAGTSGSGYVRIDNEYAIGSYIRIKGSVSGA